MDVAELLTSSFDSLEHNLVDDDPRHTAIVWIFEKLLVFSIWKWNISEKSFGLCTSSWTPKMTDARRFAFKRSEIFCIQDSNIFASSESLECNWWIFTSAKPAIFFSMNMDFGRKDRDQAISWSETWSMLLTACKLWVSLNSEIAADDLSFWASIAETNARHRNVPTCWWQSFFLNYEEATFEREYWYRLWWLVRHYEEGGNTPWGQLIEDLRSSAVTAGWCPRKLLGSPWCTVTQQGQLGPLRCSRTGNGDVKKVKLLDNLEYLQGESGVGFFPPRRASNA